MTTLTENPLYMDRFDKEAEPFRQTGLHQSLTGSHDVGSRVGPQRPPFSLFQWRRGNPPIREDILSIDKLDDHDDWDLGILLAPIDTPDSLPHFRHLVNLFGIPSAFIAERFQSITHSFGTRKLEDGSQIIWIHFLAVLPVLPFDKRHRWIKSGLVLKWSPKASSSSSSTGESSRKVTLICFQPVLGTLLAINRLFKSSTWEDVLEDPYLLINASFETWHELIDENAWKLLDLCREAERRTFEHSAKLDIDTSELLAIDYNSIHHLSKDSIHLVEGLDAVLRSLECALRCHNEMEHNSDVWKVTQDALHYRREMFHSTRLRMISVEQRLKNVINLAFNVGTIRDSRVMKEDSYVMKTLSILAMVFLPISTVSSVFGTQFFTQTTLPDATPSSSVGLSLVVSRKFWWLWIISIPLTLTLLVGWGFWIRRSQLKGKGPANWMEDIERANST